MFSALLFALATTAARSGPAVLPIDGNKAAVKATAAFVQALQDAQIGFKAPKQIEAELGVPLKPAVHACKGELMCLTQIGSMIAAQQIFASELKGKTVTVQVISVADASLVRKIDVDVGDDPRSMLRGFKGAVFEIAGITKTGDLVLTGVPSDAIVSIDGKAETAKDRIAVKPGYRAVKVMAAGSEPFQKEVYVRPGDSVKLKVALVPAAAELVALAPVKSDPVPDDLPLVEPPKPKSEPKAEPKPEPRVEAKAEPPKPEAKPEPKPEAKVEPEKIDAPKADKKKTGKKMEQVAVVKSTPASGSTVSDEIIVAPAAEAIVKKTGKPESSKASPARIPWIIGGVLTVATLASAGIVSAMQANAGAAAGAEPIQILAARHLNQAFVLTDAANALWIAGGILGAATVTLLIVDLTWKPAPATVSLQVSANRLALSGTF